MNIITLSHGSGGEKTHELIDNIFYKYFNNEILAQQGDSSIINEIYGKVAVTTDSYVIDPLFFPGGDIGKLSISGTVNDLAVSGATPLYITAGFIIEEGLDISLLEEIAKSMAETAEKCKVKIIAGDTKVVERGKGDKLYVNTTGIGIIENNVSLTVDKIKAGDKIIVSGTLGDHGITILCKRNELNFHLDIESDCNPLNSLVNDILSVSPRIKFIRDITRGGLATVLNEIIDGRDIGIVLNKIDIPIKDEVDVVCEILGLDPLYIANEGKIVAIVAKEDSNRVLEAMRNNPLGKDSAIIGEVINDGKCGVFLKTEIGGTRILDMAVEDIIPRIC